MPAPSDHHGRTYEYATGMDRKYLVGLACQVQVSEEGKPVVGSFEKFWFFAGQIAVLGFFVRR
jgi:hypothetical protein